MTTPEQHTVTAAHAEAAVGALVDGADERAYVVDGDGRVLAPGGADEAAGALGGAVAALARDAERAVRHLDLGAWCAVVIECDRGSLGAAPLAADALRFVVVGAPEPGAGYARRLLSRAATRAAPLVMLER